MTIEHATERLLRCMLICLCSSHLFPEHVDRTPQTTQSRKPNRILYNSRCLRNKDPTVAEISSTWRRMAPPSPLPRQNKGLSRPSLGLARPQRTATPTWLGFLIMLATSQEFVLSSANFRHLLIQCSRLATSQPKTILSRAPATVFQLRSPPSECTTCPEA